MKINVKYEKPSLVKASEPPFFFEAVGRYAPDGKLRLFEKKRLGLCTYSGIIWINDNYMIDVCGEFLNKYKYSLLPAGTKITLEVVSWEVQSSED